MKINFSNTNIVLYSHQYVDLSRSIIVRKAKLKLYEWGFLGLTAFDKENIPAEIEFLKEKLKSKKEQLASALIDRRRSGSIYNPKHIRNR